ncbi:MAG: CcmD family protein [Calditrichaeota bacterium]|nr:MAG: CcmD family protein [Calditrichota bacterium]
MRISFLFAVAGFLLALLPIGPAQAQVARLVHYQGTLQNEDGTPFTGTTDLYFSIYRSFTSERPIWSEVHKDVQVEDGQYEVLLGSSTPLKLSFYEYTLGVKRSETDPNEIRTTIVGSGYNYRLSFLFAAYTIVWLAIFLYLVSISRRQKKLIAELQTLAQANVVRESVS